MFVETIKADLLAYRKAHNSDAIKILSTLLSAATMAAKNDGNRDVTDNDLIVATQKMISNNTEAINMMATAELNDRVKALREENEMISKYLPNQLNDTELNEVISNAITILNASSIKDMGKIMSYLDTNYFGQFTKSVASTRVKAILTQPKA